MVEVAGEAVAVSSAHKRRALGIARLWCGGGGDSRSGIRMEIASGCAISMGAGMALFVD